METYGDESVMECSWASSVRKVCSTVCDRPCKRNHMRCARPSTKTRTQDSVMKLKTGGEEAKKAESQNVAKKHRKTTGFHKVGSGPEGDAGARMNFFSGCKELGQAVEQRA